MRKLTDFKFSNVKERFDGNFDPDIFDAFSKYIGLTPTECWAVIDRYANKNLFEKHGVGDYRSKFKVGVGL